LSNGVLTKVLSDGMSRGPAIKFSTAMRAAEVKEWLENEENFARIKKAFDSTSRFAKLNSTKCCIVGRYLYIRFVSKTGDAMGMNMLSKVCANHQLIIKQENGFYSLFLGLLRAPKKLCSSCNNNFPMRK